jgi:hypothetical protein
VSAADLYDASPVNRRRATREEMEGRAEFLINYAAEHGPVTVRGLWPDLDPPIRDKLIKAAMKAERAT